MLYSSNNVLVKHSLESVKELVGSPGCISRFWRIIKSEGNTDTLTTKIVYQINIGSRSDSTTPKPVSTLINAKSWGVKYPKNGKYSGITWVTVESSIDKFLKFVESGFPYRLGIKENGNDLKNYTGSQGIAFDLDHNPDISLDETVAILKQENLHGIIHYSPSGNEKNNKFRLILFFNEFIKDYPTVDHLTKCIGSLFPNNAQHVHDPARFFYGSILPIPHVDKSVNDFIELNEKYKNLIEIIPVVSSPSIDTLSLDDEGLTIPQKFGIKFQEWLDSTQESLGDFITKICEYFDLSLENWHLHDSPGSNLEQWRGLDPIEPDKSKTGSSFTVYRADNGTFAYKSDRSGAAGDLIDLWYRLKHHCWNIDGSVRSRINKSAYWQCLREICEFIHVPDWSEEFAPKAKPESSEVFGLSTVDVNAPQKLEKKGRILTWQDCYILKENKAPSLDVGRCCQFFLQSFELLQDTFSELYWIKINNVWKKHNQKEFAGAFLRFILNQDDLYGYYVIDLANESFKTKCNSWFGLLPNNYLKRDIETSWDHIPCKNGIFEIETKKLIPYSDSDAFITYQLPYERKSSTGLGIKTLRKFLEALLVDREAIDDLLLWIAGVVQNRGYKTRQAVSLVGDSGSGKSTLCDLIRDLIAPENGESYEIALVKNLEANKIFADDGQFNLLPLEHQRLVILSEFTGFSKNSSQGSNILKNLVAGEGLGFRVNTGIKHSNQDRSFLFRGAIITNSQDYTKFREDVGINRRLMVINVHQIAEKCDELFQLLKTHKVLEDLWNYFLDFDLEDIYERMNELMKPDCKVEWKIRSTTLMNRANNKYWSFLEDNLDLVPPETLQPNEPVPMVAAKHCYDTYVIWCMQQGERNPGTQTAFAKGLVRAISQNLKISSEEIKKRTARGINYQYVQIKTDVG